MVGGDVFTGALLAGGLITGVASDVAMPVPTELVEVTRTRNVLPTSGDVTVYVCLIAPRMFAQLAPFRSQRRHW